MPDLLAVVGRWWPRMVALTGLATLLAGAIVWAMPKKYIATATALPASAFAADKATIFNTNLQSLYSALGTSDDLDKIIGTAKLDTLYRALVLELNGAAHYGLDSNAEGIYKAVQKLKRNTTVSKSEWGELKLKVADAHPDFAAQACNGLLKKLQALHQSLRNQSNNLVLQKLKEAYPPSTTDTLSKQGASNATRSPMPEYESLQQQYSLMVATNPPVLLVVEEARPPLHTDTTEKWATVVVSFFAALLFSVLLAFYAERKKPAA